MISISILSYFCVGFLKTRLNSIDVFSISTCSTKVLTTYFFPFLYPFSDIFKAVSLLISLTAISYACASILKSLSGMDKNS